MNGEVDNPSGVRVLVAAGAHVCEAVARSLRRQPGYEVRESNLEEVERELARFAPHLLLIEIDDSLSLLGRVLRGARPPVVVALASGGSMSLAVRAIRLGAIDYLDLSTSVENLVERVDQAIHTRTLQERLSLRLTPIPPHVQFGAGPLLSREATR